MKVICRYGTPSGRCNQDAFHMVRVTRHDYHHPTGFSEPKDSHWAVCNEHFHMLINSPLVETKHLEINKENFHLCLADELMNE